jgi:hypothetical protein
LSYNNDVGALEDTIERRDELFLSRSIHSKLFPVWRPRCARNRRLRPVASSRRAGQGDAFYALP